MGNANKLVIHIGAHKTASSLLQGILRKNMNALAGQGLSALVDSVPIKATYRMNFVPRYRRLIWQAAENDGFTGQNEELDTLSQMIRHLVDELPYSKRVVSDERLLGPMPGYTNTLYPGAAYAAEFIERTFGDLSPSILLYIRDQAQYIESVYLQYFRETGRRGTFQDFFQTLDLDQFSWRRVVAPFTDRFGPDRVKIRSYDQDVREDILVPAFLSEIGYSGNLPFDRKRVNARFSEKAMEIYGKAYPHLDGQDRFKLQHQLKACFPVGRYPAPVLLRDEQKAMLMERFGEENLVMARGTFVESTNPERSD